MIQLVTRPPSLRIPVALPFPVDITYAAPHHLVADSGIAGGAYSVRATRAGDVWDQVAAGEHSHGGGGCGDACGTGGGAASGPVVLGIPALRAPGA